MSASWRIFWSGAARALVPVFVVVTCATVTAGQSRRPRSIVISPTQRILVAGFVAEADSSVDVNGETARRLRFELRREGALGVLQADPLRISSRDVFQDVDYWRIVGEEYGEPLIVTGVVSLKRAPPRVEQRRGRAAVYQMIPGFYLEIEIVLIDGSTGRILVSERLPRKSRYGSGRAGTPSMMYLAMVDSMMPDAVEAVLALRSDAKR